MIIADTNVVSEFMRDRPDEVAVAWAQGIAPDELTICVVTVEEIERGLARLPDGRCRRDLQQRWRELRKAFEDSIVVYDVPAAETTGRLIAAAERFGRPMHLADAQIAGICLATGSTLATRNVKHFAHLDDLAVLDPFNPISR